MTLRPEVAMTQHRAIRILDMVVELGKFVIATMVMAMVVLWLSACGDNLPGADPGFLHQSACVDFEADMLPADAELVVPSIVPAPVGVRIVVDADYNAFMGASSPVPGGRMAWTVWVYHWISGDYLGAIGRVADVDVVRTGGVVPRGGVCRWYDPH